MITIGAGIVAVLLLLFAVVRIVQGLGRKEEPAGTETVASESTAQTAQEADAAPEQEADAATTEQSTTAAGADQTTTADSTGQTADTQQTAGAQQDPATAAINAGIAAGEQAAQTTAGGAAAADPAAADAGTSVTDRSAPVLPAAEEGAAPQTQTPQTPAGAESAGQQTQETEWTPPAMTEGSEEQIDVMTEGQEQPAAEVSEGAKAGTTVLEGEAASFHRGYVFDASGEVAAPDEELLQSEYAILVDIDSGKVLAGRAFNETIYPASMTKILTLLVAAEHFTPEQAAHLDTETFTVTHEITDFAYSEESTVVGWSADDTPTLRDMLYGTILPSGADAAMSLAEYTAGSQETFVEWMNEKAEALGISDTAHFTNCVGLFDEDHYCTAEDMAVIMKAAVENDLCREVLGARTYTTTPTDTYPDGIELSNWFLRRIEDKDTHGDVRGAKTGYVSAAGHCAASYMVSDEGGHFVCVTASAFNPWTCIYDHVDLYSTYTD